MSILGKITLVPGDLADSVSLNNAVRGSAPDEVYNLAGMSFVGMSYQMPEYTMETMANGSMKEVNGRRGKSTPNTMQN